VSPPKRLEARARGREVHAQLVAQLPIPDQQGGTHHTMPKLTTNSDYKAYIRTRTQAWQNSRHSHALSTHA
jgi:hypothetical protein